MHAASTDSACVSDLAWSLERKIHEKTSGRVRQLYVVTDSGRVNIRGRSPSYHVKQLAIQAILDLVPQFAPLPFAVEIEVS